MDKEKEPKNSHKPPNTNSEKPTRKADSQQSIPVSSLERFEKSKEIDYEKWHDGVGYDLEAITSASIAERKAIELLLIHHTPRDWRDIEALAKIDTKNARETIKNAIEDPHPDVRIAVTRFAPSLITSSQRTQSIIKALQHAKIFSGLSQALDDVEEYHPKEVKETLIDGLLIREGEVAVLFAAMLFYLYGKAKEPFDMKQRPFFLRFNTDDKTERLKAFRELCKQLNIDPEKYLVPK
jgi:ribosomal protein L13E